MRSKAKLKTISQADLLPIMGSLPADERAKLWVARFHALRPGYTVVGTFIDTRSRLKVRHSCGTESEAEAKNWIKRVGDKWVKKCTCEGGRAIVSRSSLQDRAAAFAEKLKDARPDYTPVTKYKDSREPITLRHVCGKKLRNTPSTWMHKNPNGRWSFSCPCEHERSPETKKARLAVKKAKSS